MALLKEASEMFEETGCVRNRSRASHRLMRIDPNAPPARGLTLLTAAERPERDRIEKRLVSLPKTPSD